MALSAEAQHVVDALEAHLTAIRLYAHTGSEAVVEQLRGLGDAVLARLDAWGVSVRGEFEAHAKEFAATRSGSATQPNTNKPNTNT